MFQANNDCAAGNVTRRDVLRGAALGIVALASGKDLLFGESRNGHPNIVFMMADALGYADANSSVCSATRTALITGRYQDRLSVGLDEPLVTRDAGLPPDVPTLPSLLKKAGYGTTLVGKWHLGLLPRYGPLKSGYDHFYGIRRGAADYYTHSNDLWDQDVRVDQIGYLTDLLGSHAVNVVNGYAKSGQPFFLSLHFTAPHWPWEAPGDDSESKRLAGKRLADFDGGSQKTYEAMIEDLDRQ